MAKYDWKLTVDFKETSSQKAGRNESILNIPPEADRIVICLTADEDKGSVKKGDEIIVITLSRNFADQIKEIKD